MTTHSFTDRYDPDDVAVSTLVGQIGHLGVLCLMVLDRQFRLSLIDQAKPAAIKTARLAFMFKVRDPRKTLDPLLADLEQYGFATHTGSHPHQSWRITDIGRLAVHPLAASTDFHDRLPSRSDSLPATQQLRLAPSENSPGILMYAGENLSELRSSSSDLIRSSDQIDQIDPEEEEESEKISEPDRRAAVERWCTQHTVTGEKRAAVLADAWCTVVRLEAWLSEMQRRGDNGLIKFRTRNGALTYAITCCLNHHEPPPAAPAAPRPVVEPESDELIAARQRCRVTSAALYQFRQDLETGKYFGQRDAAWRERQRLIAEVTAAQEEFLSIHNRDFGATS